jgi:ADP-heptose:LPS heptosyltransferase
VTRFDCSDVDRRWAAERIGDLAAGHPVVVICPTTDNPLRMWDERRYVELGRRLVDVATVIFCHAPEDAEVARRFERAWQGDARCHVVQTDSFGRFGAMLAAASVVVSGDSAPMHLAVAAGTPIVAIFGPSPPSAAGPVDWHVNRVLEPAVICRSCLWGPHAPACDDRRCLDSISVDRVDRAVRELIEHARCPTT